MTTSTPEPNPEAKKEEGPKVTFVHSGNFIELLNRHGMTLALTTYQAGKLCFLSSYQGRLRMLMRTYDRAMGLCVHPGGLLLATRNQVWSFVQAPHLLPLYYSERDYDNLYLPHAAYVTGDVSAHDLFLLGQDICLVNTRFSCVARTDPERSFVPLWWPKFISRLVPEDRCHLNGVALANNQVRYAVALGDTDHAAGWRDQKATGGCVIDGPSREVIYRGLAMPHSPRLQGSRLWLLNSGCGELGYLDREQWRAVAQMPGFLRGLALTPTHAFVGLSKAREEATFGGMPIAGRKLQCGVQVVQLRTGVVEAWLEFQTGIEEIYDVQIIPNCKHPFVLGFQKEDINHIFNLDPDSNA
ncbi:TIGR03032 family protein [Candidatus Cyanaurora vandensis]|uniref:TIGR03032 family protein n=1 Tax=Candidatus Cyanaurora vandensis TaxID=2714958 RepID=UPI00257DED27|nr:TIGR03032 family protein [Candidatus Cyanaurora vandensis]